MTQDYLYFHQPVIKKLITAIKSGKQEVDITLDLGRTQTLCPIKGGHVCFSNDRSLDLDALETLSSAKDNRVFVLKDITLEPVEIRADGYYKLVPTQGAATLEINGVKMHRSKDIDPFEDAQLKTSLVVRPRDRVLDTCGGLGYSAFFAVKAGASQVISTEKSPSVLALRKLNPWHQHHPAIETVHTDISREIETFPDKNFHSIIHDPPRFTSATGDLYGRPFYAQLFRVMATQGRLFHYTGSPKRIKNQDKFITNAIKRLGEQGFQKIEFIDRLQGIYAYKP